MSYGGGGYVTHHLCRTKAATATDNHSPSKDTTTIPTRVDRAEATNLATTNTASIPTRATSKKMTLAALAGTAVLVWEQSAASAAWRTAYSDLWHSLFHKFY